jgi:hypothetical protein
MDNIKKQHYKVSPNLDYNLELKQIWNHNHEPDIRQVEDWRNWHTYGAGGRK